jgi:hypothetical protein
MATEKVRRSVAALAHVATYFLPFLFLTRSVPALAFIAGTHFVIDRWRLARYVVWAKNFIAPPRAAPPWDRCRATGYDEARPAFLSVWLLIIADNVLHICCNAAALHWVA